MAPRRKKKPPRYGREFSIRLPEDIADRIRAKAERETRPQNRIIINELAAFPRLEKFEDFANQVEEMKIVLAKQRVRISWQELSEQLLKAVDDVLAAEGGAVPTAIDRLRVERLAMLRHERKSESKWS